MDNAYKKRFEEVVHHFGSNKRLSELLDRVPPSITYIKSGKIRLNADDLRTLSKNGININWLLTGKGQMEYVTFDENLLFLIKKLNVLKKQKREEKIFKFLSQLTD